MRPVSQLPTGVRPLDPSDPGRVIDSVRVWPVDVDADGRFDLVIEGIGGGSGGPYVRIYRQGSAGFQEMLSTQGWIEPLGTVDGAPRLEVWRRAGGGEYSITRLCWKSGTFAEEHTDWLLQDEACHLQVTHRTYPKDKPNPVPEPTTTSVKSSAAQEQRRRQASQLGGGQDLPDWRGQR